jgi:hypothetical protein
MHSNTLSNTLKSIPSQGNTDLVVKWSQKLIDWNEQIEKEFIERPQIPPYEQQQQQQHVVPLHQIASEIQMILLKQIQKQDPCVYCRGKGVSLSPFQWKDGSFTNTTTTNTPDALAQSIALCISSTLSHSSNHHDSVINHSTMALSHLECISQLIRASKNIIRYNRILLSTYKGQRTSPTSTNTNTVHHAWEDTSLFGLESTSVLCSQGMIQLYLSILSSNSQRDSIQEEEEEEDSTVRDDIARQAATILFHATFAHAEEPCCKKAMRMLQSRDMNGPGIIASLLLQPNSVPVMLSLMKNVHNMMSAYPVVVSEMDAALQKHHCEGSLSGWKVNVLTILISTLSWCVHSHDFPGSVDDRRSDLAIEIIRVLFAIRGVLGRNQVNEMEADNKEIMTTLGFLMVDILHRSNRDNRVYQCKLSILMLLMDAPVELSHFLRIHHVAEELILMFWYQLNEFVVEKAGTVASERNSTSMLPILIVLNRLCKNDSNIRKQVKEAVFPPETEDEFLAKAQEKGPEKNMHPLDAPLGTTRQKLISLLTHTETNLKRCCGELLWTLCGNDSKEFILRCGFGNAVHQLGVKGMYALPK